MIDGLTHIGRWAAGDEAPIFSAQEILEAAHRFREPVRVIQALETGRLGIAFGGREIAADDDGPAFPLHAALPAMYPEWLGDREFCAANGLRFPYIVGAMANGIATTAMVVAAADAGCLGFFGAAGLDIPEVEAAVVDLGRVLDPRERPWGVNLIHSPHEPELEDALVELYLKRRVRRVSASAYINLTPAVVRYALSGVRRTADGRIRRVNHVFAKVSRPEVARRFLEPAPPQMVNQLVEAGKISPEEAGLAPLIPVAECVTVEGDSGGHTDRQTLGALFPGIAALRDDLVRRHAYTQPVHVGAAGGLGTPTAVAAAFALGAAYVLTGSVNQACIESGLHPDGRALLAEAGLGDVVMAPAADMFEMGVEVQVLSRGTIFAVRARKLYELYRGHDALVSLAEADRRWLEREVLQTGIDEAWQHTRAYWERRDPREVERAAEDPKHRMALVFRSYLGQSSRWAIAGETERRLDFQIWCGPAMAAFNSWTEGSFLADAEQRAVGQVAKNLLEGAAVVTRAQQLRTYGVAVPSAAFDFRPRPLE